MTATYADRIVAAAAAKASPSPRRRKQVQMAVGEVQGLLEKAASKSSPRPRIEVGGSYAHDTWLQDQTDVDYFLIYPKSVERSRLGELGMELAEAALARFSPRKRYAEHPYIEADYGPITVNAVPCYDVAAGEWISAADRSPFHTKYMAAHLTEQLRSQVRVLKLFLKAQGLYGAEIRVRGFSGYACEVLTLKYGSFIGVLRGASEWKPGSPLSVEGGEEVAKSLFKNQPFILLDPVDTSRNLGLAVSPSKLGELIYVSRAFLGKPNPRYFGSPRMMAPAAMPPYAIDHTLLLAFRYDPKSEDILWGELRKSAGGIASHLEKEGVEVLRHTVAAEEGTAAMAFLTSAYALPKARMRDGPELFRDEATRRFLAASKERGDSWWVGEDLRTHVLVAGEVSSPAQLLEGFMEDPVKKVGFAKGLARKAKETYRMRSGARAFSSRRGAEAQALAQLVGFRF